MTSAAPDDFTAFVASHGGRIARACAEITGNDQVADGLRDDMLAAVAGRWRRWPAGSRAERALVRIEQHLQREARAQHAVLHPAALNLRSALRLTAAPADAAPADGHLATRAWRRAERTQRRWWTGLGVVAVAAVAAAVLLPSAPPPAPPLPTEIPEGVLVLPDIDELMEGLTGVVDLPPYLVLGPSDVDALPSLGDEPLGRASLVAQASRGRLVIAGPADVEAEAERFVPFAPQQRRKLEHPMISGARLVATSLSPDGAMIALPKGGDLVLVDVRTGRVRTVEVGAGQPAVEAPVLTWLDATRVMLPGLGALVLDVTTSDISSIDIDGFHVLNLRGYESPRLAQLIPSPVDPPADGRSQLVFWPDTDAAGTGQVGTQLSVAGPPCLGAWVGPGFAAPQLVVRACDPATLALPADVGPATAAVAALDGSGNEIATLVATGGTRLDALGMISAGAAQALVAVRTEGRSLLVAWDPQAGTVQAVTHLNADAQVSVSDLLAHCMTCLRVEAEPPQENAGSPVSASPTTS